MLCPQRRCAVTVPAHRADRVQGAGEPGRLPFLQAPPPCPAQGGRPTALRSRAGVRTASLPLRGYCMAA